MPCKCSYTMCNFQWMGCERAKYAGFSAVEVSEKQFGNFTGLSSGSRSCVHKMHFSRHLHLSDSGACGKNSRIVLKITVHQMLPWFQSILDLAPTWRCSMRWNCRNNTIPEVLSFFKSARCNFCCFRRGCAQNFGRLCDLIQCIFVRIMKRRRPIEWNKTQSLGQQKLLEPACLFHALQVPSDTKCNFWMEGLWSSEVLWFVHQTLPWFQLILYLAPTEQWCCSMWSNCHCRNTCVQFLRFCHFSKAHVAISAASEEAAHRILAVSAISAERDSAFRSAEAGLCCFKAVLQIEKQR